MLEAEGSEPEVSEAVAGQLSLDQDLAKPADERDHRWSSSRPADVDDGEDVAQPVAVAETDEDEGPSSRPDRRRAVSEDDADEEDKFPWHFQFDDDEPEELQASSPLLSRAFRATIG